MNLKEEHPDIVSYCKQIENILEKNNSLILQEFKKMIVDKDIYDFCLWLYDLKKQNKIPEEAHRIITNLYGAIR